MLTTKIITPPPTPSARDLRGPVPTYDYSVKVDPIAHSLVGTGKVGVFNNQAAPLDAVYLRVYANAQGYPLQAGASSQITDVTVDGVAAPATLDGTVLKVPLAHPLATGERASIGFELNTVLPDTHYRFGVDQAHNAVLATALPTVAVRDADGWNLDPLSPRAESFYTVAGDWKVAVDAPADLVLGGTGSEAIGQAAGGVRTMQATQARDFLVAAGRYDVFSRHVDGVELRALLPVTDGTSDVTAQDRAATAATILKVGGDALHHYNEQYGAYDGTRLDIIGTPHYSAGGSEFPRGVLVDSTLPEYRMQHAVAHEVGHQWFYSMVGNNQHDHPWLDESVTEQVTRDFFRAHPEDATPPPATPTPAPTPTPTPTPAPTGQPDHIDGTMSEWFHGQTDYTTSPRPYVRAAYRLGPDVLDALEHEIGRDAYATGLRAYVAEFRGDNATPHDLVAALSKSAGRDLTGWFAEHGIALTSPGEHAHPDPNAPIGT